MSAQRPLTETGLSALLDAWLSEGPESVANRVPEAALRQIRHGGPRRRRPGWPGWMSLAAAVVLIAAGIGAWRLSTAVSQPSPTPTPSQSGSVAPSASPSPSGDPSPTAPGLTLHRYFYPSLGWAVTLPEVWREGLPDAAFSRRFSRLSASGVIEVSVGSAEGAITYCVFAGCHDISVGSLTAFGSQVFGDGSPLVVGPTEYELDGEPALVYDVPDLDRLDGSVDRYLLAVHGGRPWFVHITGEANWSGDPLGRFLDGFRFVETTTHDFPDQGFSVAVADTVSAGAEEGGSILIRDYQESNFFNIGVSAGLADGSIDACPYTGGAGSGLSCPQHFTDAGQMADVLLPRPYSMGYLAEALPSMLVDGETAVLYRVRTFDGNLYFAFVVHEGRPYRMFARPTMVTLGDSAADGALLRFFRETLASLDFTP
jgi:hypothetical protein